jgi:hypothetical protein
MERKKILMIETEIPETRLEMPVVIRNRTINFSTVDKKVLI